MKWIVQENLFEEQGYGALIAAFKEFDLDYQVIKLVPFSNIILPSGSNLKNISDADSLIIAPPEDGKIIAMGATAMTRLARLNNWNPGTYLTETFSYSDVIDNWGAENVLNADCVIAKLRELPEASTDVFIRPTADNKAIAGTVMTATEFSNWKRQLSEIAPADFCVLHRDTEMMVSTVKPIAAEYRIFVVDGQVVTGSQYRLNGKMDVSNIYGDDINRYVNQLIDIWTPNAAFVVDIARLPSGALKAIEVNCINSSGYYDADVSKIVLALEAMAAP